MQFGHYLTESSEHSAEYMPYWIKSTHPELIDEYRGLGAELNLLPFTTVILPSEPRFRPVSTKNAFTSPPPVMLSSPVPKFATRMRPDPPCEVRVDPTPSTLTAP